MATNGYYNKKTGKLVFDLIKEANPDSDFTEDQVRLTTFTTNTNGDTTRNTAGNLVAIPGMGREGTVQLTWNRPDIGQIFSQVDVYVSSTDKIKKSDLLAEINLNFGFQLATEDIYDEVLNMSIIPFDTTIRIRPTCPAFIGVLKVNIGDPKKAIDTVIRNTDLDGLAYPTNQSVKIQGPLYLYGIDYSYDVDGMEKFGYGDLIEGELLTILNRKSPNEWINTATPATWNMAGASVYYNGPTSSAPLYVNSEMYERCVIIHIDPDLCTNVAGHLIMHYNLS